MELNYELTLDHDTLHFVNIFESYLGILNHQLQKRLQKESRNPVYKLSHHSNQHLLRLQCFRLYKSCNQLTPDNLYMLVNDYRSMVVDVLSRSIHQLNPLLYPVLPSYHINKILDAYSKVKPYYSNKDNILRDDFLEIDLRTNFYSDWKRLLKLSDEKAQEFWIQQMLSLVNMEKEEQAQRTILNVIRRNYPSIDRYLYARGI